jgi:seryl-tRNA synthetase
MISTDKGKQTICCFPNAGFLIPKAECASFLTNLRWISLFRRKYSITMLEIQQLRKTAPTVIQGLEHKGISDAKTQVQHLLQLDEQRRSILTELEQLRYSSKQISKSIGQLMKEGKKAEAEQAKAETSAAKQQIKDLEQALQQNQADTQEALLNLPNTPDASVPVGKSAADNVVAFQHEVEVAFDFTPLPHWELARKHDIIDWELGVKITGSGFPVYKGKGAMLERALISYFLQRAYQAGYTEYHLPLVVNEDSGYATGQLPDKEGQMYHITEENLYLIPTAEVPLTNLYRDVILAKEDFPVKVCGYTPCFRREAGSYGRDVKGLNRIHQFDKVEIVQIVHPDHSYDILEQMTAHSESLLTELGLPFRRLLLCTGDMSFTSAKTYDLEVFSAGQDRWLEVSSISNFETYQTNRLKLRFRDEDKKTRLAHSLNGSALALPRIVASLLENNQQADGSILIPEVLRPFTGFDRIG